MPNDDLLKALGPLGAPAPLGVEVPTTIRGSVPGVLDRSPDFDMTTFMLDAYKSPRSRSELRMEARSAWQTSILPLAHPEEFDVEGVHVCIGIDEEGRRWFYQPLGGYARQSDDPDRIEPLKEPGAKGRIKRILRETLFGFGYGGLEQGAEEVSQLMGRGGAEAERDRMTAGVATVAGPVAAGVFQALSGLATMRNPKGALKAVVQGKSTWKKLFGSILGPRQADEFAGVLKQGSKDQQIAKTIELLTKTQTKLDKATPVVLRGLDAAMGEAVKTTATQVKARATSRVGQIIHSKKLGGAAIGAFLTGSIAHEALKGPPGPPPPPDMGTTQAQTEQAVEKRRAAAIKASGDELRVHNERVAKTSDENELAAMYREGQKMREGLPPDVLAAITRDYSAAWAERRAQNARRQALMDRGWAPGVFFKGVMERMKKLSGGKNAVVLPPRGLTPTNRTVRKAAAIMAGIPHEEKQED